MIMRILAEDAFYSNVRRERYAKEYLSVSDKYILNCNKIKSDMEVERRMVSDIGLSHMENSVGRYSGCHLFNAAFYQQGIDGRMRWYDKSTGHFLSFLVYQFKKREIAERIGKYKWLKVDEKHCYITTRDDLMFVLKFTHKCMQNALRKLIDFEIIEVTQFKHELTGTQKSMQIFFHWDAVHCLISSLVSDCSFHPIFNDPLRKLRNKDKHKYMCYNSILNVCTRAYKNYNRSKPAHTRSYLCRPNRAGRAR